MYDTPEKRWIAVQSRDRCADSAFVYAVMTTRIYCRPTCPSRLARRANVVFFDTCADAVAASYRACKRCKPDDAAGGVKVSRAVRLVADAKGYICEMGGVVTLGQLAEHLDISPRYLHHIFTREAGCTPAAYAAVFKANGLQQQEEGEARGLAVKSSLGGSVGAGGDGSPASGGIDIGYLDGGFVLPSQSNPSNDTTPSPWSELDNLDALASALTPGELEMLWQTYDQSFDVFDQDRLWTNADFENILSEPAYPYVSSESIPTQYLL